MERIVMFLLMWILYVLSTMSGYAAPLLSAKNSWNRNVFTPVIKAPCSSDVQCWEWLPILEKPDDSILDDILRLQSQREIANPMYTLQSWKDNTLEETKRQIRLSSPTNKQIPTRVTKKDVFAPRNWSASGMPFSVLYMNSHNQRPNHAVTATSISSQQQQKMRQTTDNSLSPSVEHPNYRITVRNGQTTAQSRRQYSIIPQLFVSYGWGSFGK